MVRTGSLGLRAHLVRVDAYREGRRRTLDEVRETVLEDWRRDHVAARESERYEEMRARYEVEVAPFASIGDLCNRKDAGGYYLATCGARRPPEPGWRWAQAAFYGLAGSPRGRVVPVAAPGGGPGVDGPTGDNCSGIARVQTMKLAGQV